MPTSYPGAYDALTNPVATDQTTSPSHAAQHANANDAIEAIQVRAGLTGNAFPGSPAAGARVLRTDRNIEYFYNGSTWLGTTLLSFPITSPGVVYPLTATNLGAARAAWPFAGVYDIRLESMTVVFHVVGGTALGASHKWDIALKDGATGTTIAVYAISSGAINAWRNAVVAVAGDIGSGSFEMELTATKTGTPGDLHVYVNLLYRLRN